jgi:hypothetical protein
VHFGQIDSAGALETQYPPKLSLAFSLDTRMVAQSSLALASCHPYTSRPR